MQLFQLPWQHNRFTTHSNSSPYAKSTAEVLQTKDLQTKPINFWNLLTADGCYRCWLYYTIRIANNKNLDSYNMQYCDNHKTLTTVLCTVLKGYLNLPSQAAVN